MNRREFLLIAACGPVVAAALPATAQDMPRLCFMTFDPGTLQTNRSGDFFDSLKDLGYVAGKTIAIDYLSAEGDGERFAALAQECLRRGSNIIAVSTTPAAKAAKAATDTVPIIMLGLVDPTETGLVPSLSRPVGNITGQASPAADLGTKRLQLLAELVPDLRRVLLLSYPADPIAAPQIRELQRAAAALGLTLELRDIGSAEDIALAFADQGHPPAQAFLTTAESIFLVNRARLIDLATRYRLPAVYANPPSVREGGLMSYSVNQGAMHRRAALQVDRILKGAKPADLPVEQPTKFELVINLKTAKALGLTISPLLLARADEVIE